MYYGNNELVSMLYHTKEDAAQVIFDVAKINFGKNTEDISVYVSINDNKITPPVKIDLRNGVFVGGSTPYHFIYLLGAQEDINDLLEIFHGQDSTKRVTHYINVATVVFQLEKEGMYPHKQFMARTQTKN